MTKSENRMNDAGNGQFLHRLPAENSVDNTERLGYNRIDSVHAIEDGRNTILEDATLSACSYDYKDARYTVIRKVVEQ